MKNYIIGIVIVLLFSTTLATCSHNGVLEKRVARLTSQNEQLATDFKVADLKARKLQHEKTNGVDPLWSPQDEVDVMTGAYDF